MLTCIFFLLWPFWKRAKHWRGKTKGERRKEKEETGEGGTGTGMLMQGSQGQLMQGTLKEKKVVCASCLSLLGNPAPRAAVEGQLSFEKGICRQSAKLKMAPMRHFGNKKSDELEFKPATLFVGFSQPQNRISERLFLTILVNFGVFLVIFSSLTFFKQFPNKQKQILECEKCKECRKIN